MVSKIDLLNRIDFEYLEIIIMQSNNIPRYHSFSKNEIVKFCSKKFTKKQIEYIFDSFKVVQPPHIVAKNLKNLNGHKIGLKYINWFKPKHYSFEVKLNRNICDVVLLDDNLNLIAIEIKADGDNIQRAPKQCIEYSKWADYVYLLTNSNKIELIRKILPNKIGLIFYDKYSDIFIMKEPAQKTKLFNVNFILKNLNIKKLRNLAKMYKIKTSGKKTELISRFKYLKSNKNFIINVKKILIK